jgi:peptidoglycan hydrolase CwlO-like protein
MRKKTSMVIGLAIMTILTASALTVSNQAFAQSTTPQNRQSQSLQSTQAHVGQALGGINTAIDHILYSNPGMIGYSGLLPYLPGGIHP